MSEQTKAAIIRRRRYTPPVGGIPAVPDEPMERGQRPIIAKKDAGTCHRCGQHSQTFYRWTLGSEAVCGFCRGVGPDGLLTGVVGKTPHDVIGCTIERGCWTGQRFALDSHIRHWHPDHAPLGSGRAEP